MISIFKSVKFGEIRIIESNQDILIVAKDVAEALDYTWKGIATISHIPDEWRGVYSVQTPSGTQEMLCLTEQGLYFFLARSDKPTALPFQKWLSGEVLPAIRRHGGYLTSAKIEEALTDPDTIIRLATNLKEERRKRAELEAKNAADRPKVVFADAVNTSKTSILVGHLAKLLRQNGVEMGQNRLYAWLRDNGYLMKRGESRNMPTQWAMEMGLFEVLERTINRPDRKPLISFTTKVTGKGQIHFINVFKKRDFMPSGAG